MSKFNETLGRYEQEELAAIFDKCGSKTKIFEYFGLSDNTNNYKNLNLLLEKMNYSFSKEKRKCLNCGKILKSGQHKFCCLSCAATFNNKARGGLSEETKLRIKNGLRKHYGDLTTKKKVCNICGQEDCGKEGACSHHSIKWFNQLCKFGLDMTKIGTINIHKEYEKVRELLYKEYYDNKLSVSQIKEKYNYDGSVERLVHVFKRLNINLRNLSNSQINGMLNGHIKHDINKSNIYHCGYHTTWNGKNVFLRSSYEFDYAKELDSKQIDYEVEWCRIKYWDSQSKTYRCAIPDFYLTKDNIIVEIKSNYTLDKQNMIDKFTEYKKLGFKTKLICEHKEIDLFT